MQLHDRSRRTRGRRSVGALIVVLAVAASVTGSAPRLEAQSTSPQVEPSSSYRYDADGRRDPFRSLVARGVDRPGPQSRPSGLPGLMIDETTVKGILRSGVTLVAMIAGPDNRTYIARVGGQLLDGSIKAITSATVVFVQDVDDPLSTVKEREVTRYLRVPEGNR